MLINYDCYMLLPICKWLDVNSGCDTGCKIYGVLKVYKAQVESDSCTVLD